MSAAVAYVEPLWSRALYSRALETVKSQNCGARARLVLVELLRSAGHAVSLPTVHRWSRAQQGQAYLWARAFLEGREDLYAPAFVVEASR